MKLGKWILPVVEHAEILGADTLVYGHLGENGSLLTLRLPSFRHLQKGQTLPLYARAKDLHVFEKEHGCRL